MFRGLLAAALALTLAFGSLAFDVQAKPDKKKNWELLGQQTVTVGADRSLVQVSDPDAMRRIQLRVKDHAIEVLSVKVTYTDGASDDIGLGKTIKAGKKKGVKLKTGKKPIKSVELAYKADAKDTGNAVIEVWGR